MMPVRRLERSKGEVRVVELGDEHGRHAVEAVQRSSATVSQHRQRVEASAGIDHGRAVGEAGEVAHHHAEAVVERHRDAQAVARHEPDRLADEEAVVEDVVVDSVAPSGSAGGAGG